ncbi:MAG: hypothetical protein KAH32_04660 [Chlamydiia bacterium]|nr:hypothetical protein [Chlamydiia bacterium]
MDNLNDYEDIGEKVGLDGESIYLEETFFPDFKSRHTIQLWKVSNETTHIYKWIGETLAGDSLHEIYIKNILGTSVNVVFDNNYILEDEVTLNTIILGPYETAHFYCTGMHINKSLTLEMRTGSQDTRK